MIEKQTDELRQVLHERRKSLIDGKTAEAVWAVESCWTTTQRKWLVEDGNPYRPIGNGPPLKLEDEFIGIVAGGPLWQPMRTEWRDLETVTEEEARKDSQL